jgi:hypothetical protein
MNESALTLQDRGVVRLSGGRSQPAIAPRERDGRAPFRTQSELSATRRLRLPLFTPNDAEQRHPGRTGSRVQVRKPKFLDWLGDCKAPRAASLQGGPILSSGATHSSSQPELRNGQVNLPSQRWRPSRSKVVRLVTYIVCLRFVTSLPLSLLYFTCLWGHCRAVREDSGSNGQVLASVEGTFNR